MMILAVLAASTLMISTRHSMGSACPIGPDLALTAAHVLDPKPFDPDVPLQDGFWSDPSDAWSRNGRFNSLGVSKDRDLGVIGGEFPAWFRIASEAPKFGDILTIQGYDWRKRSNIFATRVWRARVQYRAGQMLSLSEAPEGGASGACALNEAGEVVGILVWGRFADDTKESGIITLVYGEEFKREKPAKEIKDAEVPGN